MSYPFDLIFDEAARTGDVFNQVVARVVDGVPDGSPRHRRGRQLVSVSSSDAKKQVEELHGEAASS